MKAKLQTVKKEILFQIISIEISPIQNLVLRPLVVHKLFAIRLCQDEYKN